MMVFHEIITNFKIYDAIINKYSKNKLFYLININKKHFDFDGYLSNPWINNLQKI